MKSIKAVIASVMGVVGEEKGGTVCFVGVTQPDECVKSE